MLKLVTGATGLIGSELGRQLQARGEPTILTSRVGGAPGSDTRVLALDLEQEPFPRALLEGVDTVYHLAGVAHQQASDARYRRLNLEATLDLARAATRAGVRNFVFVSSVKAMGPAADAQPRNEDDLRPCDGDPYAGSKRAAEEALCRLVAQSDTRMIIVRPSLVYGSSLQGNLRWMQHAARMGLPRPPAFGGRSMIGLGDLAELLCRLPGELTLAAGQSLCLIATDGECYSSQRIHDALRIALGRSPGRGRGSVTFWRAAALGLDILQRQKPGSSFHKLFGWECFSNQRVLSLTDWRPRETLESLALARAGEGR